MNPGDWIALGAIGAAFLIYEFGSLASRWRDIHLSLARLTAVRAMLGYGDLYFMGTYDEAGAKKRAQADYDAIMKGGYSEVYGVPMEPLSALIEQPGIGDLIRRDTIGAANMALWQIGVFNQLVQQQTDFVTLHLAEIADSDLPMARRQALAQAAKSHSVLLHFRGIGGADWYRTFAAALDANIRELEALQHQVWWKRLRIAVRLSFARNVHVSRDAGSRAHGTRIR